MSQLRNRRWLASLSKIRNVVLIVIVALFLAGCINSIRETTCKIKFKKKYDCKFKNIEMVEDEIIPESAEIKLEPGVKRSDSETV